MQRFYDFYTVLHLFFCRLQLFFFIRKKCRGRNFIDLIRKENPDYDYLFLMRPGLTSKATLYNGYTDTMQKMLIRLQMDLEYLQQRSLWLDVKIIFTTISFILKGKKF